MTLSNLLKNWNVESIEAVEKGWSSDKKYRVRQSNGDSLLLRLSDSKNHANKVTEFEKIKQLFDMRLPVSEPLEIGLYENQSYALYKWIEGEEAGIVLPTLSINQQYQLGYQAGQCLNQFHQIEAPVEIEKWGSLFDRKMDRNRTYYQNCPLSYPRDAFILKFIKSHRHLIEDRPQTYQHGDYHTGNMIINNDNQLAIIDFNRWDFGDPWEEFNRIDFSSGESPAFAAGQVDGYFNDDPPLLFFQLMALYQAVNSLASLPWALSYSQAEIDTMMKKTEQLLIDYDDFKTVIPAWYHQYSGGKNGEK